MRFLSRCIPVALATSAVAVAAAQAVPATKQETKTYKLDVTVVDAKGKPVPGLTVATMWQPGPKGAEPGEWGKKAVTDKKGKATLKLESQYASVITYDKAMKLGAQAAVDVTKVPSVRLKMEPLGKLKVGIEIEKGDIEVQTPFWNLMLMGDKFASTAMMGPSSKSTIELQVPPGKYQFSLFSMDTGSYFKQVDIKPGETADMGKAELKLTALAKSYGKEAPAIKVTEVHGSDQGFNLADYKGKWVVLEFWGYW